MRYVSLIAAVVLSLAFVFGIRIRIDQFAHRRRWISTIAGASIAYVFVYIFPELGENQAIFTRVTEGGLLSSEVEVYLAALIGFVLFYGLDTLAFTSRTPEHSIDASHSNENLIYGAHIGAIALDIALISYLLVEWNRSLHSLVFYSIAMFFHFIVIDHSLRLEYKTRYDRQGRWILAIAVLVGWVCGAFLPLPEPTVAILVGFVAGGVAIYGLKDELPKAGDGRFIPFALGAAVFSFLLLV